MSDDVRDWRMRRGIPAQRAAVHARFYHGQVRRAITYRLAREGGDTLWRTVTGGAAMKLVEKLQDIEAKCRASEAKFNNPPGARHSRR